MSFKITISFISNENVFNAIRRLVEHISLTYDVHNREEIIDIAEKEYNIVIGEGTLTPRGVTYHTIEFRSKSEFNWFMLKWL